MTGGTFSGYPEVVRYLYGLKHHGAKYGIDRMRLLAEALGHPERAAPVIHVAGTNGKGSTCALLEAAYRAGGYRTGLYTSPHLVYQGERVQVDREMLAREAVVAYTARLRPVAEELARRDPDDHPSFFEFMTAMAFLHFKERSVEVALVETGLGGRLDATNIVVPAAAVITSISLDHCQHLGHTVEAIAREKAGIIKAGVPVVIGRLPPAAEAVVRAVAEECGGPVFSVRERFGEAVGDYPVTNLAGDYQRWNAGCAQLVTEVLQSELPLPAGAAERGFADATWSGRWDRHPAGDGRTVILDTAHNAEGAAMLAANLERLVAAADGNRPTLLIGTLGEERARALLEAVTPFARELVLLVPGQSRAATFEQLEAAVPARFAGRVRRSTVAECFPVPGQCTAGDPGETVVAAGSIYLVGEILEALYHAEPVAEQILQDVP